ncbi:IPExxxVDY family protein [uncultured Kriegella sp.]|uniref:IPExxxVDY family protein n=1 Tax=uncultured Kriegella sp. TaxID=1798910 RepID=UPI0030D9AD3E|tara:strand:+ start:153641 stop:154105 length:465 start_codon:yes stop_codon:yes gene_type:complete
MVAVHKISEDFYEISFILIAMHCSLEDHAMAYELNKCLKLNFKRCAKDLDLKTNVSFPVFEWNDDVKEEYWVLVANKSQKEKNGVRTDLFQDEPLYSTDYLIPEHKEVDYFLKIEQDAIAMGGNLLKSILSIPKVVLAYNVDTENLKSKNNLIF